MFLAPVNAAFIDIYTELCQLLGYNPDENSEIIVYFLVACVVLLVIQTVVGMFFEALGLNHD